jgi:formate dehydrogenase subunit delta
VAAHLKAFWEPRMLQALYAHVDAGGDGLEPLVLRAVERLRASA